MTSKESQLNHPSIFEGLRVSTATQIREAEEARTKAGGTIKGQIGYIVSLINKGIFPKSIDIANVNLHHGTSPMTQFVVRYDLKNNQLLLIAREIGYVRDATDQHDGSIPGDDGEARYVLLDTDQESEKVLRTLTDREWVEYGSLLVDKLEEAVQETKGVKK